MRAVNKTPRKPRCWVTNGRLIVSTASIDKTPSGRKLNSWCTLRNRPHACYNL